MDCLPQEGDHQISHVKGTVSIEIGVEGIALGPGIAEDRQVRGSHLAVEVDIPIQHPARSRETAIIGVAERAKHAVGVTPMAIRLERVNPIVHRCARWNTSSIMEFADDTLTILIAQSRELRLERLRR